MGEYEGYVGKEEGFARGDEVGDCFCCFVGDFGYWDAEEGTGTGCGGGDLGAVEEDDGFAPVEFGPDGVEDVVADVLFSRKQSQGTSQHTTTTTGYPDMEGC